MHDALEGWAFLLFGLEDLSRRYVLIYLEERAAMIAKHTVDGMDARNEEQQKLDDDYIVWKMRKMHWKVRQDSCIVANTSFHERHPVTEPQSQRLGLST